MTTPLESARKLIELAAKADPIEPSKDMSFYKDCDRAFLYAANPTIITQLAERLIWLEEENEKLKSDWNQQSKFYCSDILKDSARIRELEERIKIADRKLILIENNLPDNIKDRLRSKINSMFLSETEDKK